MADLPRAIWCKARSVAGSLQPGVIAPVVAKIGAATKADAGRSGRDDAGIGILPQDARIPRADFVRLPVGLPAEDTPERSRRIFELDHVAGQGSREAGECVVEEIVPLPSGDQPLDDTVGTAPQLVAFAEW